jgi:hypothetical protein
MAQSTCIEKMECPDCGSLTGLQTYLNTDDVLGMEWYTSFCHSECWAPKGDVYAGKSAPQVYVKTAEEVRDEIETIRNCKIFETRKPYRGIPSSFYRRWGCRLILSEFDGKTPYAIGFPMSDYGELVGWKCRPFRIKDFYGLGRTRGVDPFGLPRAFKMKTNALWWTEGEFDAIALEYAMTLAGDRLKYPTISLSHGGGSLDKNFEQVVDRIDHIDYHIMVLDDDIVGRKAEVRARELWGDKARIIRKPKGSKDANDALELGHGLEMGRLALNFKSSR